MSDSLYTLKNKNILVTGASSGIGRAIAIECAFSGANVFLTGRDKKRLNETFLLLKGENNFQQIADLNESSDLDLLVQQLPPLDGIVCNAGINKRQLCKFIKQEDAEKILSTNLLSPVMLIKKLLKAQKITNEASVVFISSIAAYHSSIGDGVYSATKGGISSFSKVLALELATKQIRVNTIQPGMVRTELLENGPLSAVDYEKDENKYPLRRYGAPQDIANAALFLLSEKSGWITGIDLVVDGGISLI